MTKKKFNPGDKFILEIGEKRTALDEWEIVGTDLWVRTYLLEKLTPYEPGKQLFRKIRDLVEGSIEHFDYEDAMDLLYQIKDVLEDE